MLKLIVLSLIFTLFVSCGDKSKSSVKVSLGFSINESMLGKAMLHGVHINSNTSFAKKILSPQFEIELANGDWHLYLTYWENPDYLGETTACRFQTASLDGNFQELVFDINSASCREYSDVYGESTTSFYQLGIVACNSNPTVNTIANGDECNGDKDSSVGSYKVKIMEHHLPEQVDGQHISEINFSQGIEACVDANSTADQAYTYTKAGGGSSFFIPQVNKGAINPFIVHLEAYSSAGCIDPIGEAEFNEGILKPASMQTLSTSWGLDSSNKRNLLYLASGNVPAPPPAFAPTDISGLVMWLDGTDASTLFQATDCSSSPVTTTGDTIKCWKDKSGNAHNATELTTPPEWEENVLNGNAAVKFNDKILKVSDHPDLDQGSTITIFAVFKEAIADNTVRIIFDKVFSSQRTVQLYLGSGDYLLNYTDSGPTVSQTKYASSRSVGTNILAAIEITNSGQTMILDGVDDAGSIVGGGSPSSNGLVVNTSGAFSIGNVTAGGSGSSLNGHIMEILYFNTQLSAQDKLDIDSYLKAKWGL